MHLFKRRPKKRVPAPPEKSEAKEARQAALESMARVDARWAEVRDVSHQLRALRKTNHFAEQINHIFAPGRREK